MTEIAVADVRSAGERGIYPTELAVEPSLQVGTGPFFLTISEALASVRAGRLARGELERAACRITISVPGGAIVGTTATTGSDIRERFPLVIDVPDVTVRGALRMQLDASGRATGAGETSAATILTPVPKLTVLGGAGSQTGVSEALFVVNGHPGGSAGHGVVIEGFVMRSGHALGDSTVGGQGVLSMRVRDLVVRGNISDGNSTERVDLRATSALVERNHVTGRGATRDVCGAGPGDFTFRGNRILDGGIPGVIATPATLLPVPLMVEQQVLPATSAPTVLVENNEVRGHLRRPVGTGLRIGAVGVGAPNVVGNIKATLRNNLLAGHTFGIIVEAAFPVAGSALRGDIEVITSGNRFTRSCQNDLLVSMSRHTTGLGLDHRPYLRNATYTLTLGTDVQWASAWYAHPAGNGNTLRVNGQTVTNGRRHDYDADKVCGS